HQGQSIGLNVDKQYQRLSVDMQTIGNLATVDKAELAWVMDESMKIFAPYLNERDPQTLLTMLRRLELWDRSFHATDITKMALYPRLLKIASHYDALASLIEEEQNIVDRLFN